MPPLLWFILGFVVALPLAGVGVWLYMRRLWRSARRLARRTYEHEHLRDVNRLVGGLAHEIKNPLSTINLNLRLLDEDLARIPDEDHRRWHRRLAGVQDEVLRLKGILDDFLQFAGKHELTLEPTDLNELLDELADFFAPQAEAQRVVMRTNYAREPLPCRVDVNLIKQAVLNLLINAIQAMPEGGELIVRTCRAGDQACVEVIDTGPGMDAATRERIFEIYFSTKKGGTGLGLSTTRRIVREHAGTIEVESEPGRGTRFAICLPLNLTT